MNQLLSDKERRLVIEVAFAGINHGLQRQVEAILPALPYLVPDPDLQELCLAILLLGLDQPARAGRILRHNTLPEAQQLVAFLPQ